MNGQLNVSEAQEILSQYVDLLNEGEDKIELLDLLEEASYISQENKELFQKALLAQMVYYHQAFEEKAPQMLARFEENMKMLDDARRKETLWEYLNRLLEQKGVTWKECLRDIGANVKFAYQLRQGKWNVMRFRPEDLAQIALLVDADPNEILKLSYQEIEGLKATPPHGDAAHFRLLKEDLEEYDSSISMKALNDDDEAIKFLAELDKLLLTYF